MTSDDAVRKDFEAAESSLFGYWAGPFVWRESLANYENQDVQKRWQVWQAATDAALERAAKEVDFECRCDFEKRALHQHWYWCPVVISLRIRALKQLMREA